MKRFIVISLISMLSSVAFAQDMYDALRYSDYTYYGTAKTMAMGNAMTAVGGDIGSIGINPAGSAVAGYSQFTITPALSIATCNGSYFQVAGTNPSSTSQDRNTKFNLPQVGAIIHLNTGAKTGLKAFSFGFCVNMTSNFQDRSYSRGTNASTSKCGALAVAAEGYNCDDIDMSLHPGKNLYASYPWPVVLGYNSGLISTIWSDDFYIGATEKGSRDRSKSVINLAGDIDQLYRVNHYGSKNDAMFNFGMNFSDQLYVGVNLGVPNFTYSEQVYLKESVFEDNWQNFVQEFVTEKGTIDKAYFSNMAYNYTYNARGSGIYGKFGFIWTPVNGVRIGGAIQTPTAMTITENWSSDAATVYTSDGRTVFNKYCKSNWVEGDNYTYRLTTPMRFNLGAALSFARIAMLSFDWERMSATSMRYREVGNMYSDYFDALNEYIRENAGSTNEFRVGLEVKPFDFLSLRAGYDLKRYTNSEADDSTHMTSFGIGYSSPGSFFVDAAVRLTRYPTKWFYPYEDYRDVRSPEMSVDKNFTEILLTLGWRF